MKLTLPFVALVVAAGAAEAFSPHVQRDSSLHARHARKARELVDAPVERRSGSINRRCKSRPPPTTLVSSSVSHTSSSTSLPPAQNAASKPKTTDSPPPPPKSTPPAQSNNGGSQSSGTSGLMSVHSSQCGNSGATSKITATTGPNGSEDWFNCGVNGGGWNPPQVTVQDVIAKDLSDAVHESNSPFSACAPYIDTFNTYAQQTGIPAIFIASIAMQESSCNKDEVGGAGEQGLMQITKDKCGGAPGGNCKDSDFNIRTGAEFFASLIKQNNGNVLLAIGDYNGWKPGLTVGAATAAAHTSCCRCQNNLDYLTQFLNGWVLGVDPSANPRIGKYFNLDQCN